LGQGAGALCIQPWVRPSAHQTWRRLDDLTGGRFALITTSVELLNAMTEADWADWQALDAAAVLISTVSQQTVQVLNPLAHSSVAFQLQERDGLLCSWLAEQGVTALLARPDHYVYGLISDLSGLRQRFNELTTQGIQTC